jgi:hypothetical protein
MGREAGIALAALATGVSLLVLGLAENGLQALRTAWEPGALSHFAIFICCLVAVGAGLIALPSPFAWVSTVAVTTGTILWAFGPGAVLSAALVLSGAAAWGSWLIRQPHFHESDAAVAFLLTTAVGLAFLVCLGNSLSHFAINGPALYIALLLFPIGAQARALPALASAVTTGLLVRSATLSGKVGGLIIGLVVAVHAAHAALPELYWDALAMHLYVPGYVSTYGKWNYDAAQYAWAAFPLGADWLFSYAFVLGGEMAAKLLNLMFGAATSWLLYLQLRGVVSAGWAGLLASASMSAPILVLGSTSLLVENTLMFFMLAGYVLLERLDKRWQSWLGFWLILAALCSVKLQGAIFAAALTVVALWRVWQSPEVRPRGAAWVLACAAFVLAVQPYFTAFWLTGNPLFPFFNAIFKSPLYPSDQNFVDVRWARGWALDSVWGMTFDSPKYLETGSPGTLGYFVLTLGPLAVATLLIRRAPASLRAFAVSFFFLAVVGSSVQYVRYFSPVLPVLTVATSAMTQVGGRIVGRAVGGALIVILLLNLLSIPSGGWLLKGFHPSRLVHSDGRAQLIRELVPQRALNERLRQREEDPVTVAYLGLPAGGGLKGTAIYYAWYNVAFMSALDQAKSEDEFARALGASGAKYLIVNIAEKLFEHALLAPALSAHATLVDRVGWAQLFVLDREFRLTPELLTNGGFDHDTHGWITGSGPTQATVGGVAVLQPGAVIAQSVPVTGGERRFEGQVVFHCLSGDTLLTVSLAASSASHEVSTIGTERVVCSGTSSLTVPFSGELPLTVGTVQVVVSSIRGGAVGVDEVSLRAETK